MTFRKNFELIQYGSCSPQLGYSACVVLLAYRKFDWILNWSLRCFQFWVTWHVGWHLAKVTGACQCTGDINKTWGCVVCRHIGFVAHTFVAPAFRRTCFLSHPLWPQSVNGCQKWCPWEWSIQTTAPGWLSMRTHNCLVCFILSVASQHIFFFSYVPFCYWVSFLVSFCHVALSFTHSLFHLLALSFFPVSSRHLSSQSLCFFLSLQSVGSSSHRWFCGKMRLWRSKMAEGYYPHNMQIMINFCSVKGALCFLEECLKSWHW